MMAFGEHKAPIVAAAVEGEDHTVGGSQFSAGASATPRSILDRAAAAGLTRFRSPWLLGPVDWDEDQIAKGGHLAGPHTCTSQC